jgi:type I restriction enzyme S subunit
VSNLPEIKVRKFTIGEVFKVSSGGTPSRKIDEYFTDGNIAWVKTGDLKGKFVTVATEFISQLGLDNSSAKVFPPKTVLLAMYGATIGACSILPFAAATNQACAAILPSDDCNEVFLYYYLLFIKPSLINKGVGGAQPNISAGLIKNLEIPLPPLAEQQKIASILDAADSLRQKDQQLIEKYTALSQSLFLEMFGDPVSNQMGWEEKDLIKLCNKITDGTHHSPTPVEIGIPYVTAKHVKGYGLDFWAKPTYIDQADHLGIYKRCSPEYGDVLYIKDGATTGIACINTFHEEISLLSSLALLKLKAELLNNHFLCFWLNHSGIKERLINQFMAGAAIKRYTLNKINTFSVPTPPISLQNQFAERILAIEAQKQLAQTSLQKSEALFNSLLQRAFKGELTV